MGPYSAPGSTRSAGPGPRVGTHGSCGVRSRPFSLRVDPVLTDTSARLKPCQRRAARVPQSASSGALGGNSFWSSATSLACWALHSSVSLSCCRAARRRRTSGAGHLPGDRPVGCWASCRLLSIVNLVRGYRLDDDVIAIFELIEDHDDVFARGRVAESAPVEMGGSCSSFVGRPDRKGRPRLPRSTIRCLRCAARYAASSSQNRSLASIMLVAWTETPGGYLLGLYTKKSDVTISPNKTLASQPGEVLPIIERPPGVISLDYTPRRAM